MSATGTGPGALFYSILLNSFSFLSVCLDDDDNDGGDYYYYQ